MKQLLLIALFYTLSLELIGQDTPVTNNKSFTLEKNAGTQMYFEAKLTIGKHLYTGNTFHDYLNDAACGNDFKIGWRTHGKKDWQKALNYPFYGFGVFGGRIGKEENFGNPIGTYGFIHLPLFWREKHHFNIEVSPGFVYNLNPFDSIKNPDNDAMGSQLGLYFNFQLGGNWILSRTLELTYGVNYIHFSNGRIKTPNYGINIASLNMGLLYNFNPIGKGIKLLDPLFKPTLRPEFDRSPMSKAPKSHDINFYAAIGSAMYEMPDGPGPEFFAWTTYLEYSRRYAHIASFNIGVDVMYEGGIEQDVLLDPNRDGKPYHKSESHFVGLHLGHAIHIADFSLEAQYGRYIHKKVEYKGDWYIRALLKYQFNNGLFLQIGLKTVDAGAADYAEFGLGYKLFSSYNRNQKKEH